MNEISIFFAVYQRIEKTSVYEIVLQLYNEAWVNGMQDPNNLGGHP